MAPAIPAPARSPPAFSKSRRDGILKILLLKQLETAKLMKINSITRSYYRGDSSYFDLDEAALHSAARHLPIEKKPST